MAIPSNYQKITIPWGSGLSGNIYVWVNPQGGNQTVYVQSDENLVESPRSKTLTFKTTVPGLSTQAQSVATLQVSQAAATYQYTLILGANNYSHDSSGDVSRLTTTLVTVRNGNEVSRDEVFSTYSFVGSSTGFELDINSANETADVLSEDRGTTPGNSRTCQVKATYVINGKTVTSNTITITQEANIQTLDKLTIAGTASAGTVDRIPYTGGYVTWAVTAYYSYSSGSSNTGNATFLVTYSLSGSGATQNQNRTTWGLNTGSTNRTVTITASMNDPNTGSKISVSDTTTQLKDNYVGSQYSNITSVYNDVKAVWEE